MCKIRPIYLLLARNDTVLISLWHGAGMHSSERPLGGLCFNLLTVETI